MFEPRRASRPSHQIRAGAPTAHHRAATRTAGGHRPIRHRPLRRYPATATITGLTAAVGGAQFIWPDLVAHCRRDGARLHDGEWWRLVTPLLVQPDGLGQYAYNLTGSVLVGVALERRHGQTRWLACYLAGGLAGNLAAYHWQPHANGAGSSDAVAGLIGALAMTQLQDGALPRWPAYLYTAHFAAYLSVLDTTSYQTAALAGGAALAAATAARHRLPAGPLSRTTATAVIAAATAMTALRDPHGIGLLSGLALSCLTSLRPEARTRQPTAGQMKRRLAGCAPVARLMALCWGSCPSPQSGRGIGRPAAAGVPGSHRGGTPAERTGLRWPIFATAVRRGKQGALH